MADPLASAVDAQDALACGDGHVAGVEADDLGDAGAGVERDADEGSVAG
ncbi:MAG TPA: hypothetical protein VEK80_12930 [Kribbellaceae bacterium]|nr:hypothetical protein [Kribbellaceae bacterium]